eukprot:14443215-Alexandrium_andersonii.AAC.1
MVGAYRRSRPACFGRMVGAYWRLRPAGFGSPAGPAGGGELGPGLGRSHLRPGPAAGVQCRPPRVVGHLLGPGP